MRSPLPRSITEAEILDGDKVRFGEPPKPARGPRALPGTGGASPFWMPKPALELPRARHREKIARIIVMLFCILLIFTAVMVVWSGRVKTPAASRDSGSQPSTINHQLSSTP